MSPFDLGANVAYVDLRAISSSSGFAPGIDTSHGTQMFASGTGLTSHNAENTGLQQVLGSAVGGDRNRHLQISDLDGVVEDEPLGAGWPLGDGFDFGFLSSP